MTCDHMSHHYTTDFTEPNFSQNISAYRKTHSCETILRLIENWNMEIDSKKLVGVVSTDKNKALDSLHPPLIVKKLGECITMLL